MLGTILKWLMKLVDIDLKLDEDSLKIKITLGGITVFERDIILIKNKDNTMTARTAVKSINLHNKDANIINSTQVNSSQRP